MKALLKFLLICLGFGTAASCDMGTVEYGTPHADYEAKGRVTDTEGNPLPGIKVQMLEDYDVDSAGGIKLYPMYSESDVLTDESGYFHIRNSGFSRETLSIGFSDIDGEENGGEFAVKVVTESLEQVEEGEGWNEGTFIVPEEMEVVLERKTEE